MIIELVRPWLPWSAKFILSVNTVGPIDIVDVVHNGQISVDLNSSWYTRPHICQMYEISVVMMGLAIQDDGTKP
jgi:hypothetical protein